MGVQLAAAEGNSSKTDFGVWGGLFSGASSFADAYNALVRNVKNYKAQEVRGGLGTGGRLGVQGGSTPASKSLGQ